MKSVEECKNRAQECMDQAQLAQEPEKSALMDVAKEWLRLAGQFTNLATKEGSEASENKNPKQGTRG